MSKGLFSVSPGPYIRKGNCVNKIILDFIIGLVPATIAGLYFYGVDGFKIILAALVTSIIAEGTWNKLILKKKFFDDLSPILNGLLLALIMPTYVPMWIVVIGSLFGVIVVKKFFGGYGQNFMEPTAATKAFLIASWASVMAKPVTESVGVTSEGVTLIHKFIGQPVGNIGEGSILAILIGGVYLLLRGRISIRAPFAFIVAATVFCVYNGKPYLLPGAFYFSAIFLATDYATSPITNWGQVIFGSLAGILAAVIAVKGYNPEGPYYAIIIMNLAAPLIEYLTTKTYKKGCVK
ncbi:RnfABCDGE type electron transport complex subunit D [uncultured Clostridium sp.]|uniref:RnfABCDGE type electron transport complex subunit D n=1 Tax=uncultured Clostridium sp. TaxID=59620 RepID=UPI002610AE89|nr:RnfABCDGE type electron transport complex subunit D [uncultured Clostridium sp.]